ncbi:MAG: PaaI family thioesterase [Deltaproteobacteria bacterium]|nr:PaaI family thioesterase [Deltaproteobacteria bacterium]
MKKFDEQFYKDRVNTFPFVKLMGMKLVSSAGGKSVMRCTIRPILRNTSGTLHGGVVGALVDMSVATALRSVMPLSFRMTTVEYKVNFLKPVSEGTVTAYGTILRRGATIAVGSTEIRNGEEEVVAFGSATYYILKTPEKRNVPAIMNRPPGRGRKRR